MRSQQKAYKEMIHHSRDSLFRDVAKRFVRNKAAVLGLIILVVILFVIIFANFLVPEELVTAYDTQARLEGPSAKHWFGTDNLGRDIFARVLYGARITVGISVGATLISLLIGAVLALSLIHI